ncbi:MAG: hypothetical protein JWM05_3301 [Acidimicrobiales bacterium]|nr:hypothetical protein [Acidimicrobiales bacterium]
MKVDLLGIDASAYERHPVHAQSRTWTETNCYVDLWIEVLHALDLDPIAGTAFTLSTDFEGDQWTFFKFPPEDLRHLYGIDVSELNVWRPIAEHVVEQLELGRLLTVEVDAWHLPDTAGVSYGIGHTKTTIVPASIDLAARRMGYFHNAGYFELEGGDFDGALRVGLDDPVVLAPYVELVRLERLRREVDVADVVRLAAVHLARRPTDNPMVRFRKRLDADLPWLAEHGVDAFHEYAFGTCRQCGATAEVAASFVDWLGAHGEAGLTPVAEHLRSIATAAKSLQFALARAARGRDVDLDTPLATMARDWDEALGALAARYAG